MGRYSCSSPDLDKFWTNLGFGAFLKAVRGKRVRNSRVIQKEKHPVPPEGHISAKNMRSGPQIVQRYRASAKGNNNNNSEKGRGVTDRGVTALKSCERFSEIFRGFQRFLPLDQFAAYFL